MNNRKTIMNKYKFEIFLFISVFILVFAVYFHCSDFGFINLDDNALIQNKVQEMESISSAKNLIFTSVFDGIRDKFYRPVLTLTFLADTLVCGGDPGFYHYSNVLWHMLAVFLVFAFFRSMGYTKTVSYGAAVVFAVHPALSSAVAWVPGRNDILLAVFSMISFIFFIRAVKNNGISDILISVFCMAAALFTKETAVVLPFIYILYMILYGIKTDKKNIARIFVCFAFALLLYAAFRYFVLSGGVKSITVPEMILNAATSLKALFWYFGVVLLTEKILIYPQINNLPFISTLLPVMLTAGLCVLLRKHCNFRHILFGILWFVLFMIPTFVMPEKDFYTHRLYLPILGCFIVIFEIIKALNARYAVNKKIFFVIFAVLIAAMSVMSYKQTFLYKDRAAFWLHAIKENPHSSQINAAISGYYADTGDFVKAEEHALAALKYAKNINIPGALTQLAEVYYRKNDMEKAAQYFSKAIETGKYRESGYLGLSKVYESEGKKEDAMKVLSDAYEILPQSRIIKKRLDNLKQGKKEISYVISLNGGSWAVGQL